MTRNVAILGAAALLLLAFIVFFERGTVSTGERQERAGRLLETLVRDKLVRVELQRRGVTTVLVRKPAPEEGLDLGPWLVEAPYAAKADADAVDSVIGTLEWIDARRTLHDVSAADLAKFGLDKPRYRVSYLVGREHGVLSVGHDTPEGSGVYLQLEDPKVAYVVGKDVVEGLDHDAEHFHTKLLHESSFSVYGARKLTLRDAAGEHVVEKRGDYFWFAGAARGLVSEPALTQLIDQLDGLHAQRYVQDGKADGSRFGLAAPRFEARLDSETYGALPKPGEKPHAESLRLRVGGACAGHDTESYIQVDAGPIMCAANADLDKIMRPAETLRELRLLAVDRALVNSVRMQSGARELVLRKDGEGYRYELTEGGKKKASADADPAAVNDWLTALEALKADSWSGAPPPSFAPGATVITFERDAGKQAFAITLDDDSGRATVGRRAGDDEPLSLVFPPSALELTHVSTARFRKHALLQEPEAELRKLVLTRAGGVQERVEKSAQGYSFHAPTPAPLERITVDEIGRVFAKLEAVRFVADAAEPSHGLGAPRYVLAMTYAAAGGSERQHQLRVGAATEGGHYAVLDDDPQVFVLPTALASLLEEPLVSRASLATALEALESLKIEAGSATIEIERRGDGFALRGAGSAQSADTITRALATLRASHVVAYGPAAPEQGFARPQASLTIIRTASTTPRSVTLLIGAPVSHDAAADVYARRSDVDVTFTLPRAAVDELLGKSAAAPATAAP